MSVTRDIVATYRGPGRVLARRLAMGEREDRALAIVMAGCFIVFVAQWPRLAREAHLNGDELNMLLGSTLLAWVFMMPLFLYVMAWIVHMVARAARGKASGFGSRLALFWALLASSPLVLFHGMVAGFIGPSVILDIVGAVWLGLFAWFWLGGLAKIHWGRQGD